MNSYIPRYLTVPQVMEVLQVSNDIVYSLIKRNELKAARIGKLLRISEQELELYLSSVTGGADNE